MSAEMWALMYLALLDNNTSIIDEVTILHPNMLWVEVEARAFTLELNSGEQPEVRLRTIFDYEDLAARAESNSSSVPAGLNVTVIRKRIGRTGIICLAGEPTWPTVQAAGELSYWIRQRFSPAIKLDENRVPLNSVLQPLAPLLQVARGLCGR